jgi:hypothetical protein
MGKETLGVGAILASSARSTLGDEPLMKESPGEMLLDSAGHEGVFVHDRLVTLPPDTAGWWVTG